MAFQIAYTDRLFCLVEAVVDENEQLDEESSRPRRAIYRDFIGNGSLIYDGAQRARLISIKRKIQDHQVTFRENITEGDRKAAQWFTTQELEGIPGSILSQAIPQEGFSGFTIGENKCDERTRENQCV